MKNILVSCWCIALCLGLLLYSLPSKPAQVDDTAFSVEPTTALPDPVPFYVSINDPAQQQIWQQLAEEFNRMSGFHVSITSDIPNTDDSGDKCCTGGCGRCRLLCQRARFCGRNHCFPPAAG